MLSVVFNICNNTNRIFRRLYNINSLTISLNTLSNFSVDGAYLTLLNSLFKIEILLHWKDGFEFASLKLVALRDFNVRILFITRSMISYFIVDKSGNTIYQSKERNSTTTNTVLRTQTKSAADNLANENYRICSLPLLVIKDLIKANLHDAIQYVKVGQKTVVFREVQGLLYIAYTKKKRVSVELLQRHLRLMHQFLKFHFGPHWQLHLVKGKQQQQKRKITGHRLYGDIKKCLSLLPFVSMAQQPITLLSADSLCYSEQVQLNDELRHKLIEHLVHCCDINFSTGSLLMQQSEQDSDLPQQPQPSKQRHQHRHSIFITNNLKKFNINSFETTAEKEGVNKSSPWLSCYLLAREKVVLQCHNKASGHRLDTKEPFLYFVRLLASNFMQEKQEYGSTAKRNMVHTMPQNISRSNSSSTIHQDPLSVSNSSAANQHFAHNSNAAITTSANITTGSPLSIKSANSSSTTINSSSQPSSLAYVYESGSGSNAPFKIKEKATSSVTIIAPDSSALPHWSNPFSPAGSYNSQTYQHHIPSVNRTPSNVLTTQQDQYTQQMLISDLLNIDKNANNHYQALHNTISGSSPYLSNSLPSDTTLTSSPNSTNTAATISQLIEHMPVLSTTSPIQRSRSHSFTTTTSNINGAQSSTNNTEDLSLRYLLTNLINNESSYSDQIEDVRLVKRWVKLEGSNNRLLCANILLVILNDGLSAVVVFGDNAPLEQLANKGTSSVSPTKSSWKPAPAQVKSFKKGFRSYLADFESFLLTKESTHFSILSFAITYPGLIHFVLFDYAKGTMTAPLLIDLNELDKNHELLHQVYDKYQHTTCQWTWPNEPQLQRLCWELIHLGLECKSQKHIEQMTKKSKDKEHFLLYQENDQRGLLAIYFDTIPLHQLSALHQQLFDDVNQRVW